MVHKVVSITIQEDSKYENTYTTFAIEEMIKYETNESNVEQNARFIECFIQETFRRKADIRTNYDRSSASGRRNGMGGKGQVRKKTAYYFENESDGDGNIGESGSDTHNKDIKKSLPEDYQELQRQHENTLRLNGTPKMVYHSTYPDKNQGGSGSE